MNILLINCILSTHFKGKITRRESNRDCMAYNMARGFVALGHNVTVVASEEYKPLKEETDNSFKTIFFSSLMPKIFKPSVFPWPIGLRKFLKKKGNEFDLIISSEVFSISSLLAVNAFPKKTIVWHELALMQRLMHKIPAKTWYNIITPLFMKKARVVARSIEAREFIRSFVKYLDEETVGHGCDGEIFHPMENMPVRDSFVMVSSLIQRKRPLLILDSFLEFISRQGFEHYHLDVIGDGELLPEMKKRVKDCGKESNVTFHGFLTHATYPQIAGTAKGLLINTLQDNSMVSIPESIALGTPVLLNSVPLLAKEVEERRLGMCRDDWGADALEEMAKRYDEFHKGCIHWRNEYTAKGCCSKILDIARNS